MQLCCIPSQASASTSCLTPIRFGRGIIRTISGNWEKICYFWLISPIDCHSAKADLWKCSPKMQFWTSTIPLGIEVKGRPKYGRIWLGSSHRYISCHFSPLEAQKSDPYRLYCLKWGCDNLFLRVYIYIYIEREREREREVSKAPSSILTKYNSVVKKRTVTNWTEQHTAVPWLSTFCCHIYKIYIYIYTYNGPQTGIWTIQAYMKTL